MRSIRLSSIVCKNKLYEHKAAVNANATRIAELEHSHSVTKAQLEDVTQSRDATAAEIQLHKDLVSRLEQQIAEHENVVKAHQDGLALLHANHAREVNDIKATMEIDHETTMAELKLQHSATVQNMENELNEARDELNKVATQVAFALGVDVSVEKLQDRISDLLADQMALAAEQKKSGEYKANLVELSKINDTVMKELETVKAELAGLLLQTAEGAKLRDAHASVSDQLAAIKEGDD